MNIIELRGEIDQLDRDLIKILERRSSIVKEIGIIKKKQGLPIEDLEREKEVIKPSTLPKGFVNDLFKVIFHYSKAWQK